MLPFVVIYSKSVRFVAGQLTGRPFMQDGVPIGEQEIARRTKDDRHLAAAWVYRNFKKETGNEDLGGGLAGIFLNYQVNLETAEFILTIPGWKLLTNQQIKGLLKIRRLVNITTGEGAVDFGSRDPFEMNIVLVLARLIEKRDLDLWAEVFPDSPATPILKGKVGMAPVRISNRR